MKWFKHYTRAREDRAIEKLIIEYGVKGYGLYFYCLEIIAGNVDSTNITFELEPDAEILARKLSMDTLEVERIMRRCVELELFELAGNGRVTCLKVGKFLDSTSTSNPEIRKIIKAYTESQDSSGLVRIRQDYPDQIRLDENRLEEIRLEKEESCVCEPKVQVKPNIETCRAHWNSKPTLPVYKYTTLNMGEDVRVKCLRPFAVYSAEEILKAIDNYEAICNNAEYDPQSKYASFPGFMGGGVEIYADSAKPFECVRKKRTLENFGDRDEQQRADALRKLAEIRGGHV